MRTRKKILNKNPFSRDAIPSENGMLGYLRLMARTAQIHSARNLFRCFIHDEARRLSSLRAAIAAAPPASVKH